MFDLAEFYTNCVVTKGVVTSIVNGHDLSFNAKVKYLECRSRVLHEDKSVLGVERLLQLT